MAGKAGIAITLDNALALLGSKRTDALKQINHILEHNRGTEQLNDLTSKDWLRICEHLFQSTSEERSVYLRSGKGYTNAVTRLPLCAKAYRLLVHVGVRKFKDGVVSVLLNQMIQSFRPKGRDLVLPLLTEGRRAVRDLLQYEPLVERLKKEDWNNAVEFCVETIPLLLEKLDPGGGSSLQSNGTYSGRTANESTDRTSRSGTKEPSNKEKKSTEKETLRHFVEDIVICLQLLACPSNAPILDKYDSILSTSIAVLRYSNKEYTYKVALTTINYVLMRTALDSTQFTQEAVQDLLPLIKNLWRIEILRDEIMIMLIHTEAHLSNLLKNGKEDDFRHHVEAFVETVHADYVGRSDTKPLQFLEDDHLCFRFSGKSVDESHPLSTPAFSLENSRFEVHWMTVSIISHISFMLDARTRVTSHNRENVDAAVNKRRRVSSYLHEYLRESSHKGSKTKFAVLQVIAFMVQEGPLDEEDIQSTLERLTPWISDEDTRVSAWAMMSLTAAAFQVTSKAPALVARWTSVWQSASRVLTSASLSRVACHLMDVILRLKLVPYASISETVEGILLSIELNGPALLTESSSSLWAIIIRERTAENPTFFNQTAERILNWFFNKWTPSLFPDRSYSSQSSQHCNAQDVLSLIYACLDRPKPLFKDSVFLVLGSVGRAWQHTRYHRKLTHYILLSDDAMSFQADMEEERIIPDPSSSHSGQRPMVFEARVLDFCVSELDKVRQRWKEWSTENPQSITPDMIRVISNCCFVASALSYVGAMTNSRRADKLETILEAITTTFCGFLSRREIEQYKVDAVLEVFAQNLPGVRYLKSLDQRSFKELGVLRMAAKFSRTLEDRRISKESFYAEDDDLMDIDPAFNSQNQLSPGAFKQDIDVPRHDLIAQSDTASFRSSCAAYIKLISCIAESYNHDEESVKIPPAFVAYLESISVSDLLYCRQFVKALLSGPIQLTKASCQSLCNHMGEELLAPPNVQLSEVANGLLLEVIIGTAPMWTDSTVTDPETRQLQKDVEDFYEWYIRKWESEDRLWRKSTNLQIRLADLLYCLLKLRPDFGQSLKLPSVRESLFRLLSDGDIVVKYHIAERLPAMFDDFILSKHDTIFDGVHSSLPNNPDWVEGIAIRLLVFSRLGSAWHTLLRRCVNYLFETAGLVEHAIGHATRCVSSISKALNLEGSQALFRIFAPQMIFSLLGENKRFSGIPFSIFGYPTLLDLLRDVEAEAIGQAMMTGKEDELEFLAGLLEVPLHEALNKNFLQSAAYSIAWDTCKGNGRNQEIPSNDLRLRKLLGDQYAQRIYPYFPHIMGAFLQMITNEERLDKALSRKPAFSKATEALKEMNGISHSTSVLPMGIEPCFTAKYLPDQIERLCRRVSCDPATFWTPEYFVLVMRTLLGRIHPALGSLHACSIIRKIRVLVALAGEIAFDGYPLQMTLQSLRPYLTDVQCADDTLGIMQYLFEHGKSFLYSNLSFVTGIGLSIFISLRVFLGSPQESTTQESQHTATMNKAQIFHSWFRAYLEDYACSVSGKAIRSSHIKAFKSIIDAASQIRAEGNATKGTAESKLLLDLLDDDRSGRKLLSAPSREVAFNLLCHHFQPSISVHDDILGLDVQAALYAPQVWQSCQRSGIGDGYLLWAARVLGRTFGAHGELHHSLQNISRKSRDTYTLVSSRARNSRAAIVQCLSELLLSDNRKEVGLAEESIRLMIAQFTKDDELVELEQTLPGYIVLSLSLKMPDEARDSPRVSHEDVKIRAFPKYRSDVSSWIRNLAVTLCRIGHQDPVLGSIPQILLGIDGLAERVFPYVVHLVLHKEFDGQRTVRNIMSEAIHSWFEECDLASVSYVRILIGVILYLRTQPAPKEVTRADRDRWLEIDYLEATEAAMTCGLYTSALLFAETYSALPVRRSRRSSMPTPKLPTELQFAIYKNLDEPDSFYGVERESSLSSVLDRLDYEADGVKSLLFRGALMDSQMRRSSSISTADSRGMVKSLIMLNMNTVTHSLISSDQFREAGNDVVSSTLHTARKLEQWDIRAPEANNTEASTIFKAFQGLHYSSDAIRAREHLDRQFLTTMRDFVGPKICSQPLKSALRTLAVLTEIDEIVTSSDPGQLHDAWKQAQSRESWMQSGQFEDVKLMLSCRETLFSILSGNMQLQNSLHTRSRDVRTLEVKALLSSSTLCRRHGALQESLASATYLSTIVEKCKSVGLDIEAVAQYEVASVLWEQGETEPSIRMRQQLIKKVDLSSDNSCSIPISVLLAKLGHHIAEARLEKPEEIITGYLLPAIKALKGQMHGQQPGQVFHEFASFCDKQLQSPDAMEDTTRVRLQMERKAQEAQEYSKLSKSAKSSRERDQWRTLSSRSKKWHDLDAQEYQNLRRSREEFLRQSLENYLLSLQACDDYNNDVLRVFSLWLEFSEAPLANNAVQLHLSKVASGKFVVLMNQLSSRLQAEKSDFQSLLSGLVFRICADHPYHGMHQIYAGAMPLSVKDEAAKSRNTAAKQIAGMLKNDQHTRPYWIAVSESNTCYHELAMTKGEDYKVGREQLLENVPVAKKMMQKIPGLKVPPATMAIEIRADCDYSNIPRIISFKPRMTIANGLSAPKIVTALASDGNPYKQLFKSGNDDLRQDAIMEQVFEQVSRLLKNHTATRLRNLHIRTYKVLPLSARSGLMEFVPNTMPLHAYLMPAHEKYYPKDWKSEQCRKEIGACSTDSNETRLKKFRQIEQNFTPVMRYFFLERFEDPDEWFEKRLAYTRTTAAISILGYVLGLGDRHCHNILLDEQSGEVVHIDLGVAFEAGRVLPVPEVVPFRLTRDLVDAMGYTKTEGVFRRCCEFTMDTLREERESIMTLLNVLRYDPLVNWSLSPLKAKRMQEGQGTAQDGARGAGAAPAPDEIADQSSKRKEDEAGEAGRALSVVEKKLAKTLSTAAAVNELIQQATDERNLAVLYSGWAAYA
ncbi:hypothetical protein K432DRAFT_425753 [Lepidopterella palustris CBS 459.81]|uniref:Serine/threonine-protein kinase Tel1 n=1 Tax=Lepidopterella palustris CBS 459.81 TaxID=1314670 RepID=A0A8E2EAZ9_9PEZI|nr:hypothetical protein K432DRAFT_425753 [Lepidopterella palustris CBS 459.81]